MKISVPKMGGIHALPGKCGGVNLNQVWIILRVDEQRDGQREAQPEAVAHEGGVTGAHSAVSFVSGRRVLRMRHLVMGMFVFPRYCFARMIMMSHVVIHMNLLEDTVRYRHRWQTQDRP